MASNEALLESVRQSNDPARIEDLSEPAIETEAESAEAVETGLEFLMF